MYVLCCSLESCAEGTVAILRKRTQREAERLRLKNDFVAISTPFMAPACQEHLEHSQIVAFKKWGNDWTFQSKPLSLMAPGIHISVTDKNEMLFYLWSTLLQIFINCECTLNLRWVCSISCLLFTPLLLIYPYFHLNSPLTTTDSKYNFFTRLSHFFNTWSLLWSVHGWQLTPALLKSWPMASLGSESSRQPCFPEHGLSE